MYEKKGRYIVEFQDIPKSRQHHIEIDLEERRGSYKEVELGFDEERALQESKRCLSCRRCLGCALCWAECKPEAIDFDMEDELFDLEADAIIVAPGVERAVERLDRRFGFGANLNVITDLQLERMLSETGPSAGLVIRPSDGEIPSRIAFVQGYESTSPQMHKAALCFAVNEAILVRGKLHGVEIQLFANDIDPFVQDQKGILESLDRIPLTEGAVDSVESLEGQSLKLTVSTNGNKQEKTVDLVVLLTQPRISKDVQALSKSLGVTLSYAAFLAGESGGLLTTDKETVKLTGVP
jgi:heterodisulfide reductase subunit A-like polyferredoxin